MLAVAFTPVTINSPLVYSMKASVWKTNRRDRHAAQTAKADDSDGDRMLIQNKKLLTESFFTGLLKLTGSLHSFFATQLGFRRNTIVTHHNITHRQHTIQQKPPGIEPPRTQGTSSLVASRGSPWRERLRGSRGLLEQKRWTKSSKKGYDSKQNKKMWNK